MVPSLPIVGQGSEPPPRGQPWSQLAEVEKYLAEQQQALQTFHEFARRDGTARFPVDFTPGIGTILTNTQRVREGSRALSLQFHVHRHKGEITEAVDCIIAQIALARALDNEPTLVSQLVRIAVTGVAIGQAQQLVQEAQVQDTDLQRLQSQLRKIAAAGSLKAALVGERVMSYNACLDPQQLAELNGPNQGLADQLAKRQPKRISDAAKMLELNLRIAEGADESLFKAREEALAVEDEIRTIGGSLMGKLYYMYTMLLTPAYTSAVNAFCRSAAQRDSADAAIAAELYRRKNGKWPAKLDDLVPEFLPAVPADPFTNQPLVMKTSAGGVQSLQRRPGRRRQRREPDQRPEAGERYRLRDSCEQPNQAVGPPGRCKTFPYHQLTAVHVSIQGGLIQVLESFAKKSYVDGDLFKSLCINNLIKSHLT